MTRPRFYHYPDMTNEPNWLRWIVRLLKSQIIWSVLVAVFGVTVWAAGGVQLLVAARYEGIARSIAPLSEDGER